MKASLSKIEGLTRRFLQVYFSDWEVLYNYRPDFLKNEETGYNLELDIYYPDLMLAVEVNGPAHKLRKNRMRDAFKQKRCEEMGIKLFIVKHTRNLFKLRHEIREYFEGDGLFYCLGLEEKMMQNMPDELAYQLCRYKPSKTAFNGLHGRVKRQLHYEGIYDRLNAEKEANKRRIEFRASRLGR